MNSWRSNAFLSQSTKAGLRQWAFWVGLSAGGLSLAWAVWTAFPTHALTTLFFLLPGIGCALAQWMFFRPLPRAFLWLVPTTLTSPLLGLAVLTMLGRSFPPELDPPIYERVAASSLILAPIAISQFFVLRRWFTRAGVWIPVAMIAWLIGFTTLDILIHSQPRSPFSGLPDFLQLGLFGAVLGGIQAAITGVFLPTFKSFNRPGA